MISRNSLVSILVLLAGLAAGVLAARGLISYLAISFTEKNLSETTRVYPAPDSGEVYFPIRIVDLGGVGILPDTARWGDNYEHNQHYFEEVFLASSPFIDSGAFRREKVKLAAFAGRMGRYGYNGIAMPWFLEVVNFDRVGKGREVYGPESPYRARHDTLTSRFSEMMELCAESGLGTYLWTDMVALTPPLNHYLEKRFGSVDTEDPAFWEVYEKAAEEVFGKFPLVEGIILRIGEAGSIYNKPGWDYTSELLVRTDIAVRLMLEAFLKAAEKYDRTVIFRTWSVGVGEIGDIHTQPDTYHRILGEISSEHLVVSTKYCSGDFYSYLGFNRTLYQGKHRRIAEFQAKREFEGFGSIPDYVGPLHRSALQSIIDKNPRLEGVWVWTQSGGPLRAGPLIIYPFYGFNVINDLNVYALSRLMSDPYAAMEPITSDWIRGYFGSDSLLLEGMNRFFESSYQVMLKGLYISEFARYDVKAMGLEPPPMLWIFEWDILGASSSVFSNLYFITKDRFREVIDEGVEAVDGALLLKQMLLEVRPYVSMNGNDFDRLVSSADYEIHLFRLLAEYRQYMMHYYRWLETGDELSGTQYRLSMGQCRALIRDHGERYRGDLNTLGMDFGEALRGIRLCERTGSSIRWARIQLILSLFLLLMGIPGFIRNRAHRRFAGTLYFDALFRPFRISPLDAFHGTRSVLGILLILYLLSLAVFSSFCSPVFTLSFGLLGLVYVAVLALLLRPGRNLDKVLISLMAPKVAIMMLFMGVVAIRGPGFFWYKMWISDLFKMVFLSLCFMLLFRKFHLYLIMGGRWGNLGRAASFAVVLLALGFQLLLAGVVLDLFGLERSLTALNNELLVLPGGLSKIMGITTHLGIPAGIPGWIIWFASGLTLFSMLLLVLLFRRSRTVRY